MPTVLVQDFIPPELAQASPYGYAEALITCTRAPAYLNQAAGNGCNGVLVGDCRAHCVRASLPYGECLTKILNST